MPVDILKKCQRIISGNPFRSAVNDYFFDKFTSTFGSLVSHRTVEHFKIDAPSSVVCPAIVSSVLHDVPLKSVGN